jgi:uncharacterized protein DUF480
MSAPGGRVALANPSHGPRTLERQRNWWHQDPVTKLDEAAMVEALRSHERKGLAESVFVEGGRGVRWRRALGRKFELNAVELAIVGELLPRGAQTGGRPARCAAARARPARAHRRARKAHSTDGAARPSVAELTHARSTAEHERESLGFPQLSTSRR